MAAPSVSGGVTIIESCDTGGSTGKAPIAPLSGSNVTSTGNYSALFGSGIENTGAGRYTVPSGFVNTLVGGCYALSSAVDFTTNDRLLLIHITPQGLGSNRIPTLTSSAGLGVFANSSSTGGDERMWNVVGSEATKAAWFCAVVNVSRTTGTRYDIGTFDDTDVTHIGVGCAYTGSFVTTDIDQIGYLERYKIINGETTDKGDFTLLADQLVTDKIAPTESPTPDLNHQFFFWGIGDGTTETHFEDDGRVFEFVREADFGEPWGRAHIDDNDLGFELNASANDVITCTNYRYQSNTPFHWRSKGSTSATISWPGLSLTGAGDVELVDGHEILGGTIDGCTKIVANDPTITSTTIKNASAVALEMDINSGGNLTAITFENNGTDILIDAAGSGTLDVTECTFNSSSTYYIEYTGTGTLTVTSSVSIASGKLNASGGGTINVVNPTADLTVNSSEAGSQIVVYTTNTQTALDTELSATQLVYTHSSETVDVTVHKDGFIPFRRTNLPLSGNQTIDVQLVKSREYNSSHGLTYGSGNDGSFFDNRSVITNITQANPAVVTYSGPDNWSNNDIISIQDVVGMTEVNGKRYTVANVNTTANTFELSGIDSSAYTAYSSAGVVLSGLNKGTFGPSVRGIFSLFMEQHRTNSALDNTPWPFEMDGFNSLYMVKGVEGLADSDIENMTAGGVGYLDIDGTQTATWVGIESVGTIPGSNTGEWTADDATTINDARASGVFDEIIKLHGDADHGNFDNRANRIVMKMNINGYREQRVDVRALYGVSGNFAPNHYVVPISPKAINAATGDPGLTTDPVITDNGATPATHYGKDFSIVITDGATPNTAEDILRHLNYFLRSANDTTLDGNDPFSWPEMIEEVGNDYQTLRGYTEDAQTSTLKGVIVLQNDGVTAHAGFLQFEADDGTYYVNPVSATGATSGMLASSFIQVVNSTAIASGAWASSTAYSLGDRVLRSTGLGTEYTGGLWMRCTTAGTSGGSEPTWDTTAGNTTNDGTAVWTTMKVLITDGTEAGEWSLSYTDGEEAKSGDTLRARVMKQSTTTYYKPVEVSTVASSSGFTFLVSQESWGDVEDWGWDSSAITKYIEDGTNIDIDITGSGTGEKTELVSWWASILATSSGMWNFWGAYVVESSASIRQEVSVVDVVLEKTSVGNFEFTDNDVRYYRSDFSSPYDTSGNSIFMDYSGVPLIKTTGGTSLTAPESAAVLQIPGLVTTIGNPAAADLATDIAVIDSTMDSILDDTGSTIPDLITASEAAIIAQIPASEIAEILRNTKNYTPGGL